MDQLEAFEAPAEILSDLRMASEELSTIGLLTSLQCGEVGFDNHC